MTTTLFHYCSVDSFLKIIESKSIHLSSMNLSNDSMEGKLFLKLMLKLADDKSLSAELRKRLARSLEFLELLIDGLAFCLSQDGDLLSQWRGYADDASGVSIGFSEDYLVSLSKNSGDPEQSRFLLSRVIYDPEGSEKALTPLYDMIIGHLSVGAFKVRGKSGLLDFRTDEEVKHEDEKTDAATEEAIMEIFNYLPAMYSLKGYGFREEQEARLLSFLIKGVSDQSSYKARSNRVVPYRSFRLKETALSPILRVILGPKNNTPRWIVEKLLETRTASRMSR